MVEAFKTMNYENWLIIGAGGMLGSALQQILPGAMTLYHVDMDITDKDMVIRTICDMHPDVVLNAAGYTNVDGCESHQDLAYRINGEGPGFLAEGCRMISATLLHYSTDYVFGGEKECYMESDIQNPRNVYGSSKMKGEINVIQAMTDFRIIRTSWMFGPNGKNFVDSIIRLSQEMDVVPVVNDQFGKPTYSLDLAEKTKKIISLSPGIYHITNEGICSWYELASSVIPNAVPCSSSEYPRPAVRPRYSVLKNTKTSPLRQWKDALADYLDTKKGQTRK